VTACICRCYNSEMQAGAGELSKQINTKPNIFTNRWAEPAITLAVSALLMIAMNAPAFQYGLYAEYFEFVGNLYKSNGNLIQALFLPSGNDVFVRPVDSLLTLLSYRLLSYDPFILHVRNLVLALVMCGLLYALSARYVSAWYARVFPVLWFALAKPHFEGIGVLSVFGTLLASIFILATVLMLDIYLTRPKQVFYLAAIVFGILAIFSKESAVSVLPTAVILVFSKTTALTFRERAWRTAKLAAPFAIGVLALFLLKRFITGHALPVAWMYAPQVSGELFSRNFIVFTAALGNLALSNELQIGVGGIGWFLGHQGLLTPDQGQLIDIEQYIALAVLLIVILWQRWRYLAPGLFAMTLMMSAFAIYASVQNLGLRYEYEFLIGAAFLGALLLDQASRPIRMSLAAVLVVFGMNGAISTYNSYCHWQYTADTVSEALPRLLAVIKESGQQEFVFVTKDITFWDFAIGASGDVSPMLPELADRSNIQIKYATYQDVGNLVSEENIGAAKIIDLDNGFLVYPDDFQQPLSISQISPSETLVNAAFNVQPDGSSAIAVFGQNITPGVVVYWNDQPLLTAIGGDDWVSATVPNSLFSQPGNATLYLDDGFRRSQPVIFRVLRP
jgi:hypothetical protein